MKHFLTLLFASFVLQHISAQHSLLAVVKIDSEEEELLAGVLVKVDTTFVTVSDSVGQVLIENITSGEHIVEFSLVGYFKKRLRVTFPLAKPDLPIQVTLLSHAEEIEEVIVTTTRNYQKAEYLPTRVEVVDNEEVEEGSHDKPSDVSHVIREQPGVQVQRTSATAGTMRIRLQGLSGRYVQTLKDGFPVFGGASNLIGITQIPPLDLQQVEIIKGPSSTLYGADAIAGVINLVSKTPTETPVYDILFNGESANAYDVGLYASQKVKWFAFSLTGLYRWQKEKDWNNDHFIETPKLQRYTISPQLYFDLSKNARLNIGATYTNENRVGGTLEYTQNKVDSIYSYFEKNKSEHITTNFKFDYNFNKNGTLTFRNSFNIFNRDLKIPIYFFNGTQLASVSEINYRLIRKKNDVVLGIDFRTDKFTEAKDSSLLMRNYNFKTYGFFVQYIYNVSEKTSLQAGLRIDYNSVYKVFPLPHIAVRHTWNSIFTTRLNVGMGYKLPTIFQDESEEARFVKVLPILSSVKPELSLGGTVDLKIKLPNFNGLNITLTQLYFLTHIFRPLLPAYANDTSCKTLDCEGFVSYKTANGYIRSGGVETGINLTYRGFSASLMYTLTDNNRNIDDVKSIAPLTSKHIVYMLAGYQIKNFSVGIDAYYFSPVKLSNGSLGRQIWEVGINLQYSFKYMLLFANFENIAGIRQTNFSQVVYPNPSYAHPRFAEIYAPLEGRLLNVGFKLHLAAFARGRSGD